MNLGAIREEARFRLQDRAKPYLWSDEWLNQAINEAEREACIRARLIEDVSSVASSIVTTTTEKRYALHPTVLDVLDCCLESNPDVKLGGWTLTESELVFDDFPATDGVLLMTVIRMPLSDMTDDTDEPEIRAQHHLLLVDWVVFRAFSIKDADGFDPNGAARAFTEFERSFGPRHTVNVQRKHRAKTGRVVRMAHF